MRRGLFANYQGREFEAVALEGDVVRLIYRGERYPEGFVPSSYAQHLALKEVPADQVQLYTVTPMAVVRGLEVELVAVSDGGVLVRTPSLAIALALGMEAEGEAYRRVVEAGDVERITERATPCEA